MHATMQYVFGQDNIEKAMMRMINRFDEMPKFGKF
jgi:hypothetical protein